MAFGRCTSIKYLGGQHTFVFEEVAHSRAACENQLRHVLDNLGFILWRKCGEPFSQALYEDELWACNLRIVLYIPLCPAWTGGSSSFDCQRKTHGRRNRRARTESPWHREARLRRQGLNYVFEECCFDGLQK